MGWPESAKRTGTRPHHHHSPCQTPGYGYKLRPVRPGVLHASLPFIYAIWWFSCAGSLVVSQVSAWTLLKRRRMQDSGFPIIVWDFPVFLRTSWYKFYWFVVTITLCSSSVAMTVYASSLPYSSLWPSLLASTASGATFAHSRYGTSLPWIIVHDASW